MFLQILPPDNIAKAQSIFENELLFVLLGSAITIYAIFKIIKLSNKIKV